MGKSLSTNVTCDGVRRCSLHFHSRWGTMFPSRVVVETRLTICVQSVQSVTRACRTCTRWRSFQSYRRGHIATWIHSDSVASRKKTVISHPNLLLRAVLFGFPIKEEKCEYKECEKCIGCIHLLIVLKIFIIRLFVILLLTLLTLLLVHGL